MVGCNFFALHNFWFFCLHCRHPAISPSKSGPYSRHTFGRNEPFHFHRLVRCCTWIRQSQSSTRDRRTELRGLDRVDLSELRGALGSFCESCMQCWVRIFLKRERNKIAKIFAKILQKSKNGYLHKTAPQCRNLSIDSLGKGWKIGSKRYINRVRRLFHFGRTRFHPQ